MFRVVWTETEDRLVHPGKASPAYCEAAIKCQAKARSRSAVVPTEMASRRPFVPMPPGTKTSQPRPSRLSGLEEKVFAFAIYPPHTPVSSTVRENNLSRKCLNMLGNHKVLLHSVDSRVFSPFAAVLLYQKAVLRPRLITPLGACPWATTLVVTVI